MLSLPVALCDENLMIFLEIGLYHRHDQGNYSGEAALQVLIGVQWGRA